MPFGYGLLCSLRLHSRRQQRPTPERAWQRSGQRRGLPAVTRFKNSDSKLAEPLSKLLILSLAPASITRHLAQGIGHAQQPHAQDKAEKSQLPGK